MPAFIGPRLGGKERLENPRQVARRDPAPRVPHRQVHHLLLGVRHDPQNQSAATLHRLPSVDHKVQEHLLDLIADCPHRRRRRELRVYPDPVLHHLPFEQHQRLRHQPLQIRRLKRSRPVPRRSQHQTGDLRRPLARRQDLLQRLVPSRLVLVPQTQLRIVDDGHQHIVEFMRRCAHELANRRELLRERQLRLQHRDPLFETLYRRRRLRHSDSISSQPPQARGSTRTDNPSDKRLGKRWLQNGPPQAARLETVGAFAAFAAFQTTRNPLNRLNLQA